MDRRQEGRERSRSSFRLSFGLIIFAVFALYVLYNVGASVFRRKIQIYEVGQVSSAVKDKEYVGLILREETAYTADSSGYVNYYIQSGARTAVGNVVCALDPEARQPAGTFSGTDNLSSLSENQLESLKKKLAVYAAGYDPSSFEDIYDVKMTTRNMLLNYLSSSVMGEQGEAGVEPTQAMKALKSGVVEYYKDGMEGLQEKDLTNSHFDSAHYSPENVTAGTRVEQGAFVYKVIDSEGWDVYINLTKEEDDVDELSAITSIDVHFNDVNLDATAEFSLVTLPKDGLIAGRLHFDDYLVQLADRRYTSITLLRSRLPGHGTQGLKIPKSAVLTKEVYIIPESFATESRQAAGLGFLQATTDPKDEMALFITPTIYAHMNGYYYVDVSAFPEEVILLQPSPIQAEEETEKKSSKAAAADSPAQDETTSVETESSPEETRQQVLASFLPENIGLPETESTTLTMPETLPEKETTTAPSPEEEGEVSPEEDQISPEEVTVSPEETREEETETETEEEDSNGEVLVKKPKTSGLYHIGGDPAKSEEKQELMGVLNINKGYCVFRFINVLEQTDDYYIVKAGDEYGVAVYDHILLDATSAQEGDIIYR